MINPARPTEDEKDILFQHFKGSKSIFTRQRAHIILLNSDNHSVFDISKILYVSERTVRNAINSFNELRISSIFSKKLFNQNAAKLTREQKNEIKNILSKPPSAYGLPKEFWEIKSLKRFVKTEFDVEYQSKQSYYLIFRICDFSFHTPAVFSIKRDEKLIEKRMLEIREEIKPFLKSNDWAVLVADETRLLWQSLVRKAWFPKGKEGKKTIIKVENIDEYQNFFGALNLKTGKPHLIKLPWQNQEEIIKALKYLKRSYKDKKICLIWDNAAFHKGKKIRQALKEQENLKQYHLIALPPYAPDKNPQERIWGYAKREISNYQTSSLQQTVTNFRKVVTGRTYPYKF